MKKTLIACLCLILFFSVTACGVKEENTEKVCDMDFTVLRQEEIPDELATIIDQKKAEPFHLTYEDEALYIAIGYGEKDSGGYSIEVEDLYLGKTAVCFDTKLIGPKKSDKTENVKSYPYIVVKTEYREERVIFKD